MAKVEVISGEVIEEDRSEAEVEVVESEAVEVETEAEAEAAPTEEPEQPEIVVQIGDEEPEEDEDAKAPAWVRELRKTNREQARKIKELEAVKTGEAKPAELGPKPTRADCDFDDDEYDRRLEAWYEQKRQADAAEQERKAKQEQQEQAWNGKLSRYGEAKQALGAKDYEDAETLVTDTLSITQQGIIVQGAENPALVTYALGKNPTRTKELAKIADPIEFAFAVAKLEAQLKVTNRNNPPPPEKRVTGGSAGGNTGPDATLDRLRSDAAKTGDYSKVIAYKREKAGK